MLGTVAHPPRNGSRHGGEPMNSLDDYAFTVHLDAPYQGVRERVEAALKEEGFGIITEIDVKQTFKTKLDLDFRQYAILGACNPVLANRALGAEPGTETARRTPLEAVLRPAELDRGADRPSHAAASVPPRDRSRPSPPPNDR